MLMAEEKGNLAQVRAALHGITGVDPVKPATVVQDWYMWIVRSNYELQAVDSLRRHGLRAYWPSYQRLVATRRQFEGRPIRRMVRIGIIPYVLSPCEPETEFFTVLERSVAVIEIVRTFSGKPLFLRDVDLGIIRKIDAGLNTPKPEAAAHNLKCGEKVRFIDDIMAYWPPGKIIKLAPDGRIIVEVNMMGQKVPVTVFPFQIARM